MGLPCARITLGGDCLLPARCGPWFIMTCMIVLRAFSNRIRLLPLVLVSLALASCGKTDEEVQQIPPVKTADTTFGAAPNPIVVTDGTKVGLTTLSWSTSKSKAVEVRVSSPGGTLMAAAFATGTAPTGKWVTDGMQFYLQDASVANKTDASATLAVLTVKVIQR
jgi:hypothetical protein